MKINLNSKDLGWASAVVIVGSMIQMGAMPVTATLVTILFFAKKFGNIDNKTTRLSLFFITGLLITPVLGVYAAILQPNWKAPETEAQQTVIVEPTSTPEIKKVAPMPTPELEPEPKPFQAGEGTIKMCSDLGCEKSGVITVKLDPDTKAQLIILGAGDDETGEAKGFGLVRFPGDIFRVRGVADETNLENPTITDGNNYDVDFHKENEIVITEKSTGFTYTFYSSTIPFPTN